jgi:hypothetical protein
MLVAAGLRFWKIASVIHTCLIEASELAGDKVPSGLGS